jgi:hypothetical protein
LSWRLADRASIDAAQVRAMKRDPAPPEAIMLRSTASSPWRRMGMARQTTHNCKNYSMILKVSLS